MSNVSVYHNLGWHTQHTVTEGLPASYKESPIPHNVAIISGYFPVLAIPTAVAKIYDGINRIKSPNSDASPSFCAYMITRGSLELTGVGGLFLIPDLIVSLHRHCCSV